MPELEGLNPEPPSIWLARLNCWRSWRATQRLEPSLEAIRSEPGSYELDRQRWQQQPIELQKRLLHAGFNKPASSSSARPHHRNLAATEKPGRRPPIALSHGWQLQAEASMLS